MRWPKTCPRGSADEHVGALHRFAQPLRGRRNATRCARKARLSKRTRVFVGILLVYAIGVGVLIWRLVGDIDPRYRESAEESLVETAYLAATLVEQQSAGGKLDAAALRPVFRELVGKSFEARIFDTVKTGVELRLLVVDAAGMVVFDSTGRHEGDDYSRWRDIQRALRGEYGARTSADIDGDPASSVMWVAAPIRVGGQIVGAASAGKPLQSLGDFIHAARRKTLLVGATSVAAVLLLAVILSVWLVRPFGLLADYLRYARAQRSFSLPRLGRRALGTVGAAFDEMRDALAGRSHVADYVQTLTHELKSPLSSIRGAAELLQEPAMPDADRQRFVANIARETQRIQELVDRMMELTALESRRGLERTEPVALVELLHETVASARDAAAARRIAIALDAEVPLWVQGDALLLRRAVANLLDNAVDFSPDGGAVQVVLRADPQRVEVRVRDHGPGIPDYADDKVFEKFYSLARPHSQKKSTGLGLPFVKEIAELHQGRITLRNAEGGGAIAVLTLPRGPVPIA
jgi:two-component system sensor histidine kinase CreC